MEDVILRLTTSVAGLKAELAATRQRYETNRSAEVAGHQADLEVVITAVDAMRVEAAAMEVTASAPGPLAEDAVSPAAPSTDRLATAIASGLIPASVPLAPAG